jgi:hypothetical protein
MNNKFHGKGKFTYPNGVVYDGDFCDHKFHGKGKFTYVKGGVYEGDFVHDEFQENENFIIYSESVITIKEENPLVKYVPLKKSCQYECIVCMDAPRSVLLLPCKHLALCNECWQCKEMKQCPCCRGLIDSAIKDIFTI